MAVKEKSKHTGGFAGFLGMKKVIESVNFNASAELVGYIDDLFDDLDRYNDRIVSSDIYLEVMNETKKTDKNVRIKVFLPGEDIFVEQGAEDFITAAQQLYDRTKRLITDEKEKLKEPRRPRPDKPWKYQPD